MQVHRHPAKPSEQQRWNKRLAADARLTNKVGEATEPEISTATSNTWVRKKQALGYGTNGEVSRGQRKWEESTHSQRGEKVLWFLIPPPTLSRTCHSLKKNYPSLLLSFHAIARQSCTVSPMRPEGFPLRQTNDPGGRHYHQDLHISWLWLAWSR